MREKSVLLSLKALLKSVCEFIQKDFHLPSYVYTLLFALTVIAINYICGFYQKIICPAYDTGASIWIYPLFYLFVYFAVAIPTLILRKEFSVLRNKSFYIKAILFISIYGCVTGFYVYNQFKFPTLSANESNYILRVLSQFKPFCFLFVPILLMRYYIDKDVNGLYGLSRNTQHIKAYVILFLIMLPFLIATSFTSDFLSGYPQFHPWYYNEVFGVPVWLSTSWFETIYSLDFVMVELIFRGVLVIGMISIMDRKSVLPMIALYAAIHIGKPPLETFSSIFGGYILGALAYQTKHIWGGVIVHISIALTMEILGFAHYYLK